jgi:nitrous oxide reductase accessory protein NosL
MRLLRALTPALLLLALPGPARPDGAPAPAAGDKCAVCGMFVAKYPDWVAGVTWKDGTTSWFDGAKDLFKFLLHPERSGSTRTVADADRILVTDYYAVTRFDARRAFFVIGSDVYGPMGAELIPFEREADAREFLADHHGSAILRFSEVDDAVIRRLQGGA